MKDEDAVRRFAYLIRQTRFSISIFVFIKSPAAQKRQGFFRTVFWKTENQYLSAFPSNPLASKYFRNIVGVTPFFFLKV